MKKFREIAGTIQKNYIPELWSWLSSALVRVFPYPVCGLDDPDLVLDERKINKYLLYFGNKLYFFREINLPG